MKVTSLSIPDVLLIEPCIFEDARGFFFESFREDVFKNKTFLSNSYIWSDIPRGNRNSNNFKKVGFVDAETDPSSELRDPFAEPNNTLKAVKKSSDNYDELDETYFLSGTLVSDKKQFCIIISPEGDSKYYVEGDFIIKNNIENILSKSILVNRAFPQNLEILIS